MGFENLFNKFAGVANGLNHGVNKVIGKDVFKDVKPMDAPREFAPYSSYSAYSAPEPEQWPSLTGNAKSFTLEGNTIFVSEAMDICMQYRKYFKISAEYYTEQFKFKYQQCVKDYDSLIHYFPDLYNEGLIPMIHKAYSLLLPFGVFTVSDKDFSSRHIDTYQKAIDSYSIMMGIEESRNQAAENLGNKVGGSIRLQGGGFGFKGAMKGVAQAEAFNFGMGMLGKLVAHQSKLSQEEKEKVFAEFKHDVFFQEVYSDYYNTFLSLVQTLIENGIITNNTTTFVNKEYNTMFLNLQNPMFPNDKFAPAIVQLITANPFFVETFGLLENKLGQTEEVKAIVSYFVG